MDEEGDAVAFPQSKKKHGLSKKDPFLGELPKSIKVLDPTTVPEKLSGDYIKKLLKKILPASAKNIDAYTQYIFSFDKLRRSKSSHKGGLSGRQQRHLATFKFDKNNTRFEQFLPLHNLWEAYMKDVLELTDQLPENLAYLYQKLIKADYHGCFMVVAASKCPHYIGIRGIMVQETRNVFRLVTTDNKLKIIPKKGSVFCFELSGKIIKIYGNNFRFLPYDRLKLKYKRKSIVNFHE